MIVQNGDSRKDVIALGQSYFAVQTRKMELTEEEFSRLDEDQKNYILELMLEIKINIYLKQLRMLVLKIMESLIMLAIKVCIMVKLLKISLKGRV